MPSRLSTQAKRMRGTTRPDRVVKVTALSRLEEPPPAPDYLSEGAKLEWAALAQVCVEIGVLTLADRRALALLAESLTLESELREALRREGLIIPGANGNSKAHSAIRGLETIRAQAMRLLSDFGLNPRARLGVDMLPRREGTQFSNNGNRPTLQKYLGNAKPWE